jgi:acyl-CoA thioesterase II
MTAQSVTTDQPGDDEENGPPSILDVLELETIEQDLYRSTLVFPEERALYGGQVAAQALLAAGLTVDPSRRVHSLHGYFLRKGASHLPAVFQVFRDRDGGSFSARRVVAVQRGEVIFNMSASFALPRDSYESQAEPFPDTQLPGDLPQGHLHRLFSVDARLPRQPFADRMAWPTRFWARSGAPLPDDPLLHACALTYVSDISTGLLPDPTGRSRPGPSLDHAVWFHGPIDLNDWLLLDYHPRVSGHGRGWYTGSVFTQDGTLVASLTQEQLFR